MKAIILAGGYGTRISEETHLRPKPMVEIGGMPILWHIMKIYSAHGINEFVVCCGYKGNVIKDYFSNYFKYMSDVTFNLAENSMHFHQNRAEPWKVTLVDTGQHTMTGGRLLRVKKYVEEDEIFCFTYGDGVGNINISKSIKFHRSHGKQATLVTTSPPGRFGSLNIEGDHVKSFREKPRGDGGLVNGGFFVLSPKVFSYLIDDKTVWEQAPLEKLAEKSELMAFAHHGFWQPMDTLKDKMDLEALWLKNPPWKIWEDINV